MSSITSEAIVLISLLTATAATAQDGIITRAEALAAVYPGADIDGLSSHTDESATADPPPVVVTVV